MHALRTVTAIALLTATSFAAEAPLKLWPAAAPGETSPLGPERDDSQPGKGLVSGKSIIRLTNVSEPTLTVFPAPKDKATGAAVLICPGGAYNILAYDLEGTEVCEWLNSIGVTGVLVKYRVPARKDRPRHEAALQDAQRAISLTRAHAAEWGIDPKRIGVLGFSAGGHLAALTCGNERSYPAVDAADAQDCHPNFACLIYPAYLTQKDNGDAVSPEVKITTKTPPTFISISQDDPVRVENALFFSLALKTAKVPCELHIYPTGGHGYGLRRTESPVTAWPDRAADWMKASGWLKRP